MQSVEYSVILLFSYDTCCTLKAVEDGVSRWTASGLRRVSSRRCLVGRAARTGSAVFTTAVVHFSAW